MFWPRDPIKLILERKSARDWEVDRFPSMSCFAWGPWWRYGAREIGADNLDGQNYVIQSYMKDCLFRGAMELIYPDLEITKDKCLWIFKLDDPDPPPPGPPHRSASWLLSAPNKVVHDSKGPIIASTQVCALNTGIGMNNVTIKTLSDHHKDCWYILYSC